MSMFPIKFWQRNSKLLHKSNPMLRIGMLLCLVLAVLIAGVTLHASSTPHAHAAAPNSIQTENSLPGDPTWNDFSSVSQQDAISGYGSSISVNHGSSIDFFVTTTAASFTIDVFRTGWYGGVGARKVTSLGSFTGIHQAIPQPDPVTGMIACKWTKATTLSIPTSWTTGVYLAKLTASSGNKSFIFFVVRNDGGYEDIALQTSVTTYQAYNVWGGLSLYDNTSNKKVYSHPHATKVSFDRPFDPNDSNGAGHYLYYEYPFVRWAESKGYDLTYITDVDTHTNVNALTHHKAFLSVGHDEYWSKEMRTNVQNAIASGVNVGIFSANTDYWQIRFEPSAAGVANRVEVGYKDFATSSAAPGPDPQWNVNNAIVTTNWRSAPVNMPENAFIGVMYQDQVNNNYPYIVQNASNWIYAGTGFVNGSSVPGIVGYEYDKVWNNGFSPSGLTVLSNSPVVGCCEGSGHSFSNSTLYTAASGARVFAGGTIQWSWGLDNYSASYANAGIQKTTANILNNFIGGTTSAPAVSLNPSSLTFGNQILNTASTAQTITLTNSGNAALTISSVGLSGTNAADFAQTNNCPGTLAASSACSITVTFTPTSAGSRTASISISDNAPGAPHSVALTGAGVATGPTVSLSPTSLTFGNQVIATTSTAQAVTLKNTGNAALTITSIGLTGTNSSDFAQTNACPATLATGASCTINVTFTPGAIGARSANLSVSNNAPGSPHTITLSGSGVNAPAPAVNLNPSSLTFSNQAVGTPSPAQTVTLTNTGNAALTMSSISLIGTNSGDFTQTNNCPLAPSTLIASGTCTISVVFKPTAVGTSSASVSISDSASGSPHSVVLTGTGGGTSSGLFSDGFESGSLPGNWSSTTVDSGNTVTLDTTLKHSGNASLKAVIAKGSNGNALISKSITGQTTLDVRGYYYLNNPVNFGAVNLMSLYAQGNFIGWVTYNVDPSSPTFTVYNGANNILYNCTVPSLNAWHSIELQYVLATNGAGSFTLWLDGVKSCGATGIVTSPQAGLTVDQVTVGSDSADNTVGLTVHVDDVVINKSYIGV